MKIYLAGSVPKGDKEAKGYLDWRKEYIEEIRKIILDAEFFDPNIFNKLEGDSMAVAGADSMCIQESDLVIVNASEKLGAGTSMEFVVAKYFGKPVVTVLPKESYHRRQNLYFDKRLVKDWVHPFVELFSDFIIEDISKLDPVISNLNKKEFKTISIIDQAVDYAKEKLRR